MNPYSEKLLGNNPFKTRVATRPAVANCARCGVRAKLTNDHIIPLAILKAMGMSNNENFNIQRLCVKCNSHKASQLDPKNPRTRPLMLYYLDRWSDLYQVPRKRRMYVFRNLPVRSLTPDTYHFVEAKEALRSIYWKQIKRV